MIEKLPDNIDVECIDPVDGIIYNYSKLPSILKINIFVNHTKTSSINKVNQSQIEKEILELNPKKSAGYDAIPWKVIKDAFKVLESPPTQLFNISMEETLFPDNLKYAIIAPLCKKDDNTNKENYRPISILPSISKMSVLLNEDKCQLLIIKSSRISRNDIAKIKTVNKTIEEVKSGKLLGITLSNNLTMGEHIKRICKQASNKLKRICKQASNKLKRICKQASNKLKRICKQASNKLKRICKHASNKLDALARISHILNEQKRKILMNSFILTQFNYCPIVWMYCQRKSNNLINGIHERALRIAYNDYVSDFDALLIKDDYVTIHQRNINALTIEIYKTLNDLNPVFMKEIFCLKQYNFHTRNKIHGL